MLKVKSEAKKDKTTQFHCQNCGTDFCLLKDKVCCPTCGSKDLTHMVIIYQEHDSNLDHMYTKTDWTSG